FSGAASTNAVFISDPAYLVAGDVFTSHPVVAGSFVLQGSSAQPFDLTAATWNGTWTIDGQNGTHHTVIVDSSTLSHILHLGGAAELVFQTASAALDLSNVIIASSAVFSTNETGTTFTVNSADTGVHVIGGPGNDTLILQGAAFTDVQRTAIFAQGLMET